MHPIVILGAGINGAAIARELLLNRVPVCLVDIGDLAGGTTAYSSRLIHGGLRYLEHGEFDLVRESLAERTRLLQLAPHLVHPLRLFIPIEKRFGGLFRSGLRFIGFNPRPAKTRGLYTVKLGLSFYDYYARDKTLPKFATHTLSHTDIPAVNREKFRWLCSYYDAQVCYPERFVVSLLTDCAKIAAEQGVSFEFFPYHRATLNGKVVGLQRRNESASVREFTPTAILNATGAWVDHTLAKLKIPSDRLIGGTKGAHLLTHHAALREAIGENAIYAEAADGRPFFILPFGTGVLIGTTDLPFDGDPAHARADEAEIEYLLGSVLHIFPQIKLSRADVELAQAGVRPLPYVAAKNTASITRRHWLAPQPDASVPTWSIIGGKLTTCRSLAEETAALVLNALNFPVVSNSQTRSFPGGDVPHDRESTAISKIAHDSNLSQQQLETLWPLCGSVSREVLLAYANDTRIHANQNLPGTEIPEAMAAWAIEREWATTLEDLVERRLMLLFHRGLIRDCLQRLAEILVVFDRLPAAELDDAVDRCAKRLGEHFGKRLA